MLELFIKNIKIDAEGRIVIAIHDQFSEYLIKDDSKKMIKETLEKILTTDFVKLEVAKTSARVTVAEGQSETCKQLIEAEMKKAAEMAAAFMSQMNQGQES
ncbi:hypothetical protein [Fusibacter sp. 3D3]|uniref:hypothetical protein n=1 Tax=Fusibacter sp. 3D3 TaxID=1048380 RepID=UPI0008535155|nr:hypothetical protein [Fusibacter sp. 3D3]GAU76809.1 hypothetical protein F3D3_1407 [Fusibacter sp. 3D3]